MCGIAGFLGTPREEGNARQLLRRMVGAIHHRGPDDQGYYCDPEAGLGHARLSIIDLATGQQPLANEDGTIWVTFNGEIFNYVELHADLVKRGHHFITHSDTETIVHAYEERGPECVQLFNGDFAFALWDRPRKRLVLARDRMGVRPIYYAIVNDCLVFASEMKALFQYPGIRAEIDPVALDQCFTFWFPLAPRTPFKGIFELPPGHILVSENGTIEIRPYWRLQYPDRSDPSGYDLRPEPEIAEELETLLLDATRIRLRADVPVGAYLSGGLDSSVTTALIKLFTSQRLRTFSVTFESAEFDEARYQQEVVKALETDHESVTCTAEDIGHLFPRVIEHTERPILRTAPTPLYRLSGLVRENNFKVVLTGEGADEIFAGYDIFKEAKIRRFWARQPASTSRPQLLRKLYPYLTGIQGQPQPYLRAFFGSGLDAAHDPLFSHLPRWKMTAGTKAFFSDGLRQAIGSRDAIEELRAELPPEFGRWHPLNQAQFLETAYLLPGYILSSQGDRVAMAHAVEGRFPFLDHRVVEFAARLRPRLKIRGLIEKYILRRSVGRHLPEVIAHRTKQPYRSPDSQSFFGPRQPEYVPELLSTAALVRSGLFDHRAVEKLVQKCQAGSVSSFRDNMALVGVLSVQLLHDKFVRGESIPETSTLRTAI